ncbi:MAG: DUF4384 domain-containing protein, partial [Xanthomonadales bacterium]|nr:DUF4384 domain-containing protein [Xanthomonadales bacterium]
FVAALTAVITRSPERTRRRRRQVFLGGLAATLLVAGLWWASPTKVSDETQWDWLSTRQEGIRTLRLGDSLGIDEGLQLSLQLDRPRYVHVINQDLAGQRFQLFPLAAGELRNPLPAGHHQLPGRVAGEPMNWQISSAGGREFFLIVLSDEPIPELAALSLTEAGAPSSDLLAQSGPVRGMGGLSPQPLANSVDWSWLAPLRARYPQARFETFELAPH